ncbi:MAG: hypothetical protein Ct9H300mP28_11080 [Pseudomonadota bacterium]|nr:MAG: hypothetical protein Ct9H300mP28_11080 [Pseudomonadota bacterium]
MNWKRRQSCERFTCKAAHLEFGIRLGSQIVAWGTSDSLRLLMSNPTDNREYGMTGLEDVRIPFR